MELGSLSRVTVAYLHVRFVVCLDGRTLCPVLPDFASEVWLLLLLLLLLLLRFCCHLLVDDSGCLGAPDSRVPHDSFVLCSEQCGRVLLVSRVLPAHSRPGERECWVSCAWRRHSRTPLTVFCSFQFITNMINVNMTSVCQVCASAGGAFPHCQTAAEG